jgi:hypothetical protein
MPASGAMLSRRELTKTNRQPSSRPKSGHCSRSHASSRCGSDQPLATCSCLSSGMLHTPRAMLPPVLNTPQRNSGTRCPTQL